MSKSSIKLSPKDICLIGLMVAVIEVCKVALSGLPNIELTTFWIIVFSLFFGKKIYFAIPVFILVEGAIYGFGLWWIMYLYTWPVLALLANTLKKTDSAVMWSLISGIYGSMFGLLCSVPYFFIGAVDAGITGGLRAAFTWWVAGIPWDIVHGISNFAIMLVLYHPITRVMEKCRKYF